MIKQLKLRTRLFAGFGLMALFSLTGGLLDFWSVGKLGKDINAVAHHSVPVLKASMEADMAHDCIRASVFRALLGHAAGNTTEVEEGLKEFREAGKVFGDSLALVAKTDPSKEISESVTTTKLSLDSYVKAGEEIAGLIQKSAAAPEIQKAQTAFQATFEELAKKMDKLSEQVEAEVASTSRTGEQEAKQSEFLAVAAVVLAVLSALSIAFLLDRQISRPLAHAVSSLEGASLQVADAADQISDGSQSLAKSASEQAASLEETSASLEEISAMTKRNAESAGNGKALSEKSRSSASTGLERVAEMGKTLTNVKGAVGEMESAVREMQSSSQEIAKIIRTIDEIAFQTNLLALNAAVEAARAGEAGAGFAVVADEVRALAQRSAQAAKDTSERIEAAVKRSELGGVASRKVSQSLGEIETSARSIEQVFTGIVSQVTALDEIVGQISSASKEQSQGVGEVNMAVGQMDKVTQSNAAYAEENASAAEELNAQVGSLKDIVGELRQVVNGAGSEAADTDPAQQRARQGGSKRTPLATRLATASRPQVESSAHEHSTQPPAAEAGRAATADSASAGGFKDF